LALLERLEKELSKNSETQKQRVVPKKPRDEEAYRGKLEQGMPD